MRWWATARTTITKVARCGRFLIQLDKMRKALLRRAPTDNTPIDLHSFPSANGLRSPHSEVHPNDSASVVDDHDDHVGNDNYAASAIQTLVAARSMHIW